MMYRPGCSKEEEDEQYTDQERLENNKHRFAVLFFNFLLHLKQSGLFARPPFLLGFLKH